MLTYPKTENLYRRDPVTHKLDKNLGFKRPEFDAIDGWYVTEKVDGTNIRIGFSYFQEPLTGEKYLGFEVNGRSDNAQLSAGLHTLLLDTAEDIGPEVKVIMEENELTSYTLYGEGYGAGIQKGGGYSQDKRLIFYDILINDRTWLSVSDTIAACLKLGVDHVPVGDYEAVEEIVDYVKTGFLSLVAAEYGDKTTVAEGVVCHPRVPLYTARGERVMFKLKTKDLN